MLVGFGEADVEGDPVGVAGLKGRVRDGTAVKTSEGDVREAEAFRKRRLRGVLVVG